MAKPIARDQCCLCGKSKEQVRKLIVGLQGGVCIDCIELCNDILHSGHEWKLKSVPSDWDGTVVVASEDRDVYVDPNDARRALSAMADLIRGYAVPVDREPG
jgi:ATP-dependent protease Clp ATPase subunit